LWRYYFKNLDAFIYVLDSNDRVRFSEAESELSRIVQMLEAESLEHIPMLVYCNKQDLPNAVSVAECTDMLGLHTVSQNHRFHVQSACFTSGEGIFEGLDWLAEALKNKKLASVPPVPAKSTEVDANNKEKTNTNAVPAVASVPPQQAATTVGSTTETVVTA